MTNIKPQTHSNQTKNQQQEQQNPQIQPFKAQLSVVRKVS